MSCPRVFQALFVCLLFSTLTLASERESESFFELAAPNLSLEVLEGSAPGQGKKRTVYYLPYTMYYVGAWPKSKQVVYLGTVESAVCTENHSAGYQSDIIGQYTQHIEGYYKASLKSGEKGYYRRAETIGYWRWDRADELVGMRARIAGRYPNLEYVSDFKWFCK